MDVFFILQILFDAVLLFGLLFLFHFSVHQLQRKKEEGDIFKNMQVQEIKENLQELLLTLKQLGKEVSDDIQEQVREAEQKTEAFKGIIQKMRKDLNKTLALAEEVSKEKERLEEKWNVIQTAKKPAFPGSPEDVLASGSVARTRVEKSVPEAGGSKGKKTVGIRRLSAMEGAVGFSSAVVKEIYRLADQEAGIDEIVRRTRLSRAEIQLILNLRSNRFSTTN